MTETLGSASSAASAARGVTGPLSGVAQSQAADRLKAELREYLAAQATRLLTGGGQKLGAATVKLTDIAEGRSPGSAQLALDGGRKLAEGKGPLRSALELGASRDKDSVSEARKNLGGGKGKRTGGAGNKPTVIIESVDVGVPLRTAYDQWTQYQDFSTLAKGVKSANRADDANSDWQLKVFWSNRSWKAHTTEQTPDDRIAWTSEGAKGTTKGVVSFHRLADNLTLGGEAEDGWRGEIRDGEVVRSHEDAVAEEDEEAYEGEEEEDGDAAYAEEENGEYPDEDTEEAEGEYEAEYADGGSRR
jgi:hypothetical protein